MLINPDHSRLVAMASQARLYRAGVQCDQCLTPTPDKLLSSSLSHKNSAVEIAVD